MMGVSFGSFFSPFLFMLFYLNGFVGSWLFFQHYT